VGKHIGHMAPHICDQCSKVFMSYRAEAKYCSHECFALSIRKNKNRIVMCPTCGRAFTPTDSQRKFCSPECSYQAMRDVVSVVRCPNCGKILRSLLKKHGHRKVFCSTTCAGAYRAKQNAPHVAKKKAEKEGLLVKRCKTCGKQFKATNMNQLCCSDECKRIRDKDTSRVLGKARHVAITYTCKQCGNTFSPEYNNKARVFCSDECLNRYKNPITRRTENSRRRALLAGAKVEKFRDVDIFERDAWTCQICGQPVDREARGYDLLAPSLDHIIPLARGGSHTKDNVRCVHFICNSLKSDADDIVAKERARRWFARQKQAGEASESTTLSLLGRRGVTRVQTQMAGFPRFVGK
jgi:endogenous inhibitor of DNA gyrase (YacG/DUF329 family)